MSWAERSVKKFSLYTLRLKEFYFLKLSLRQRTFGIYNTSTVGTVPVPEHVTLCRIVLQRLVEAIQKSALVIVIKIFSRASIIKLSKLFFFQGIETEALVT